MKLNELVKTDARFEKSVNLLLDLTDDEKLKAYIPTRSSVAILKDMLMEVDTFSGHRATALIGPYGKGKSHLLLVLLAALRQTRRSEFSALVDRIRKIDAETAELIGKLQDGKKMLPVIISTSQGSLSQVMVKSLNHALRREGLTDIVPDSYFTEAVKKLKMWEEMYPDTFENFNRLSGMDAGELIKKLGECDDGALEVFRNTYPKVTAGSSFNPLIEEEPLTVFRSVNRKLCEKHGYKGIYIVFDEFSKYIEGHSKEGFSADMKVLQDIAELCNSSKDEQLHLTCVAHKSIRSYGQSLPKEVLNAFKGVEGRLTEKKFVVSSKNNYELIAYAINKNAGFEEIKKMEAYKEISSSSYKLPEFSSLFRDEDEFNKIICEGCYPFTPLAAMCLLGLSEKIAQNERTLFTFIASREPHGLDGIMASCEGIYVGADRLYDYFVPLFEDDHGTIHNEYLKAEYALGKTSDGRQQAVIKALAVLRMTGSILPNDQALRLALGAGEGEYTHDRDELAVQKLVAYSTRDRSYDFVNGVSVDIENLINDYRVKYCGRVNVTEVVNSVLKEKYVLPKKYNHDYQMTRFFGVQFMETGAYMNLADYNYLDCGIRPDGMVLCLIPGTDASQELADAVRHASDMGENRIIVVYPGNSVSFYEDAKTVCAVTKLLSDRNFVAENQIIIPDIESIRAEAADRINRTIRDSYFTMGNAILSGKTVALHGGLNRIVSDVCCSIYDQTPVINNESINRNRISAQISKARNTLLEDIMLGRNLDRYLTGTSPEATIYRSVFTGREADEKLEKIKEIISDFIFESKGKKNCFSKLVDVLENAPYGMRRGVMPLYIMEALSMLDDMPVIYTDRKKELSLSALAISNVMDNPKNYYLYVEEETGQKLEYIGKLEKLFGDYGTYCRDIDIKNKIAKATCLMQGWYRSLPQAALTFKTSDTCDMKKVNAFRRIFSEASLNPREVLFDRFRAISGEQDLEATYEMVVSLKNILGTYADTLKAGAVDIMREKMDFGDADLCMSLKDWAGGLDDSVRNSALSSVSRSFLGFASSLSVMGAYDIAEKTAKMVTGLYIEDWKDGTADEFAAGLEKMMAEFKSRAEQKENSDGDGFTLTDSTGKEICISHFSPDSISTSGGFLKNMLDDAMSECGDTVDNEEKIGILMNMIKELMS